MESANLNLQLHQDHDLVGSSTLATSCLTLGDNHALSANFPLNSGCIQTSSDEVLFRYLSQENDSQVCDSLNNTNLQGLCLQNCLKGNECHSLNRCFINPSPKHDHHQHHAKSRDELPDNSASFPKLTDLFNGAYSPSIREDEEQRLMSDLSEELLLKTLLFSPGYRIDSGLHSREAFEQLTQDNIHAMNLFSMTRLSAGRLVHPSLSNNLGLVGDRLQLSIDRVHQYSRQKQSSRSENNGVVTDARTPSNIMGEPKASQSAPKRACMESSASCPPFKVRKERLGDRIVALQQLVAPFGKTDTASVLMEAIGNIKFLHNQVETLSAPYMKLSSSCKNSKTMQQVSRSGGENAEPKPDLGSFGLCLVPLDCMSCVANVGDRGSIWPKPQS